MNGVLLLVLSLSLSGGLLILVLLLCGPLLRGRVSRRWQYYIWLVVIARLLLPLTPEVSLMGSLFQKAAPAAAVTAPVPVPEGYEVLPGDPGEEAAPASEGEAEWNIAETLRENLWMIWLGVAAALLLRKITVYQGFVKYIKAGWTEVSDTDRLDRLAQIGEQMGVRRPVELYVNPLVSSPLLLGFFRPCIILPGAEMTEADFTFTVRHELTHYRRGDMFYKWLVQAAVCLHWFNPLVWVMTREVNRACELACDEAVITGLDGDGRRAYGDALLRAMESGGSYRDSRVSVALHESAELLKERLDAIMKYKKSSKLAAALSAVLAVILLLGGTAAGAYTGPVTEKAEPLDQVKGDSAMEHYYTQDGYYEAPYMFELGWNVKESTGKAYANTKITLPGIGTMTVYYADGCKAAIRDKKVLSALSTLLERLWEETKDTKFPMVRPAVLKVENTGTSRPAGLVKKYYEEGSLPQFGAAFALLGEKEQKEWLEEIYDDGEIAFFSVALSHLKTGGPLIEELAEEVYDDGNIAFFSVLAGYMSGDVLEDWAAQAKEDGRTNFRAMLYDELDRDEDLESMKSELDRQQAEAYRSVGVTKVEGMYYYQGERVNIFLDLQKDNSFYTLSMDPKGSLNIKIIRDGNGNVTGVEDLSEAEIADLFGEKDDEDDWDDWDDDWSEGDELVVNVGVDSVSNGAYVWLGTFELEHGDVIHYDVSAEKGERMAVGFARPGVRKPDTTYMTVSNKRTDGELEIVSGPMVWEDPVPEGEFSLFVRAKGDELENVTGYVTIVKAG